MRKKDLDRVVKDILQDNLSTETYKQIDNSSFWGRIARIKYNKRAQEDAKSFADAVIDEIDMRNLSDREERDIRHDLGKAFSRDEIYFT